MKKKLCVTAAMMLLGAMLCACDSDPATPASGYAEEFGTPIESEVIESKEIENSTPNETPESSESAEAPESSEVSESSEAPKTKPTPDPATMDHTNMYKSELTGEWISKDLENQRPVAIMVDNEILTYPHYGINQADIVYEMMNSTANGRITRFMCIVKDYEKITRFGGVRSIRPTNFLVGFPYEAIFCHDGGPFFINEYTAKSYCDHFSGIFARYTRPTSERPSWATSYAGKSYATEFTEFATYENYKNPNTGKSYTGLKNALANAGFSKEYSSKYKGTGLVFGDDSNRKLGKEDGAQNAKNISLPYPHTSTELKYNAETGTYDLYEYGHVHTDAEDNNNVTTFKNVLLLKCDYSPLGEGYMIYNYYNYNSNFSGKADGFYLTNGTVIAIKWEKSNKDTEPARYYNAMTQEELVLNPGKVYINIVPSDIWPQMSVY